MRLWTTDGDPEPVDVEQAGLRPATTLEAVAALIAEGGEIVGDGQRWATLGESLGTHLPPGRCLVYRISVEEGESDE